MKDAAKTLVAGVITCAAFIIFVATFVHAALYAPAIEQEASHVATPAIASTTSGAAASSSMQGIAHPLVPSEQPSRLVIPVLGVDAHVQKVGIARSGNMMPPSNFTDAGWYRYGVVPGQPGSAVMAGHVDNGLSLAGVFSDLHELKPGDEIIVVTEKDTRLRFVVQRTDTYPYADAPAAEIFSVEGPPRLRLITCAGDWVQSGKTYDQRLVVTAELASDILTSS